jgi:mevalonate kinase
MVCNIAHTLSALGWADNSVTEAKLKQLESTLETFIDVKQGILVALGVGHPALDMIINTGKEFGFHSKLTGAGGGGCGFTLIPRRMMTENSILTCCGY